MFAGFVRHIKAGNARAGVLRWLGALGVALLAQPVWSVVDADLSEIGSAALRAKYDNVRDRLDRSPFARPIIVDSTRTDNRLDGEVYGVVEHPFSSAERALQRAEQWCEILLLHLNVKDCRISGQGSQASSLSVYIGGKFDAQPAFRIGYRYRVVTATSDYLRVALAADVGPLGTRDYAILFEAAPLNRDQTFVHLAYSYSYGTMARLAMETYLQTIGRTKVGFTVVGQRPDGRPVYVRGTRGVVERNAMRYYLAIEAYLDALSLPQDRQFEDRLRRWFELTEQHSLQLHEMTLGEYLDMKLREHRSR